MDNIDDQKKYVAKVIKFKDSDEFANVSKEALLGSSLKH